MESLTTWWALGYGRTASVLRVLRVNAALTQRELASRLGKPQSTIHSREKNNRRVDVVEFVAWAVACNQDPDRAVRMVLSPLNGKRQEEHDLES